MTPRRGPMSENEKAIAICLLFPPLWVLLVPILLVMLVDKIKSAYWDLRYRRAERLESEKYRDDAGDTT
jgi:hypothetical protein